MLKAVFYARFHPDRGPSIIHQYPPTSIVNRTEKGIVSWNSISSYIIPPYDVCNQPLSICLNGHRVLGYPVSVEDPKYERNRFTFNVCFVLSEDDDVRSWESIVCKTAASFRCMEEEDELLQTEEMLPGLRWAGEEDYPAATIGVVYPLLECIFEDLNTYGETCWRIDDFNILNLRLTFPRCPPPKVRAWDVPLLIRSLPDPNRWTWDLTLQRIHTYIDGVKHVQKIAELADVELKLAKQTIRELVYHGRAMLLDLFHFQAIYACTRDLAWFAKDTEMQDECVQYVRVGAGPKPSTEGEPAAARATSPPRVPRREDLIHLYTALSPGVAMAEFWQTHRAQLAAIDLRRLITFGVIQGFVRRIHKFAITLDRRLTRIRVSPDKHSSASGNGEDSLSLRGSKPRSNDDAVRELDRAWKRAALSSGWATPPSAFSLSTHLTGGSGSGSSSTPTSTRDKTAQEEAQQQSAEDEKLAAFLDGAHCMDEICVAMHRSEKAIVERLRSGRFGEVVLFNK